MPDLAESSLEFIDQPVYDEYLAGLGEDRLELVGQASSETISNEPLVSGWAPALGTAIRKEQTISLTVAPAPPNDAEPLRRVMLFASFPTLGVYEVVHDGDNFSQAYPAALGNTRVADGLGFVFTVLRREGWPASPRLVPVAVDVNGAVNAVSSQTYSWTLTP